MDLCPDNPAFGLHMRDIRGIFRQMRTMDDVFTCPDVEVYPHVTMDQFCASRLVKDESPGVNAAAEVVGGSGGGVNNDDMPYPESIAQIRRCLQGIRTMWQRDGRLGLDGVLPGYPIPLRKFARRFVMGAHMNRNDRLHPV